MELSGEQFAITAGDYAAVVTESGAGLRSLTWRGEPLVLTYEPDRPAPAAFGQLLIPWPNRIDRGRYTWKGEDLQLDLSEPERGNAIHGLARWLPWHRVERSESALTLGCLLLGSPGYPFRLRLEVAYALDPGAGLTVTLSAVNEGDSAAPYAHGAHPYLCVGERIDGCTVNIPAREHLPVDERMIPRGPAEPVAGTPYDFRQARRLGELAIDRAFTGLERGPDGRAWVHLAGAARTTSFWLDGTHPWLEIYTADSVPPTEHRKGLGVEPMTCPPNGFAGGIDVISLEPGAGHTGSWGIKAG